MESTTKICQQCKEEIKASAKKCRYCHSMQGGISATLSNPAYTPFVGIAVAIPFMLGAFYFMGSMFDRNGKEKTIATKSGKSFGSKCNISTRPARWSTLNQISTIRSSYLPNTEHAFRLRDNADKPETEYASHKVFIRYARDADDWP